VYMLFFAGISLTEINPRSTTVPEDRQWFSMEDQGLF
jgi:hypothetical protein